MKTPKIVQDKNKPYAISIIADSIIEIAQSMKRINTTRLTRDCIVTLLARDTSLSRSDIETVLESIFCLEERWLKKPVVSNPIKYVRQV